METKASSVGQLDEMSVLSNREAGFLLEHGQKFRLIDLFAGAGGLTLGFTPAFGHTFEPVWANEWDTAASETYTTNFGTHCVTEDIVTVLEDAETEIPSADVVVGGPPCQGFSLLNKQRDSDPRKHLWRPFLEVVERSNARVFVMENVPQLLGSPEHAEIESVAHEMGFKLASAKLLAADYGVPQRRWRAFIIGSKQHDPHAVFPPTRTHSDPKSNGSRRPAYAAQVDEPQEWMTVADAIRGLPSPVGTEVRTEEPPLDLHFGRNPTEKSKARYRAIPEEGMNRFDLQRNALDITPACWIRKTSGGTDLFGRLWWDKPAFTIRTEFFKPEKGRYLHPVEHRPITHREAARFQSFPDTFRFKGTKVEIARQIGNAVPPKLAARVADAVYALLATPGETP